MARSHVQLETKNQSTQPENTKSMRPHYSSLAKFNNLFLSFYLIFLKKIIDGIAMEIVTLVQIKSGTEIFFK